MKFVSHLPKMWLTLGGNIQLELTIRQLVFHFAIKNAYHWQT